MTLPFRRPAPDAGLPATADGPRPNPHQLTSDPHQSDAHTHQTAADPHHPDTNTGSPSSTSCPSLPADPSPAAPWRHLRRATYLLLLAAVAVLVIAFWPTLAGIWRRQALTFVVTVAVMGLGVFVQACSLLAFLDTPRRLSSWRFAEVWAWSALANYAAPLQPGIAVRVAWLRRHDITVAEGLLATWRRLIASIWLVLPGLGAGLLLTGDARGRWPAGALLAIWAIAVPLRRFAIGRLHRLARPSWLLRRRDLLLRAASHLTRRGLVLVALQYVLGAALTYGIYLRFGASIEPGQALLICCLASVSSVVALLPGNLGIVEAIYLLAGHQLGLDVETAAALALFIRVAHIAANLLWMLAGRLFNHLSS